jgi:hypothetical protein
MDGLWSTRGGQLMLETIRQYKEDAIKAFHRDPLIGSTVGKSGLQAGPRLDQGGKGMSRLEKIFFSFMILWAIVYLFERLQGNTEQAIFSAIAFLINQALFVFWESKKP